MAREIDKTRLYHRQETYLIDHYLSLHNTVVGVALAVAGLGAASLIGSPKEYHGYQILLWVLWSASVLATATAYAGTMIGSIVLPAQVPAILDLFIPLLIGVSELLLFGILAHQATGISSPSAVVTAWFFSCFAFCLFCAVAILRAALIIDPDSFTDDIALAVSAYRKSTYRDVGSASSLGVVAFVGGISNALGVFSRTLDYVFAGLITGGLVVALATQSKVANRLRTAFR